MSHQNPKNYLAERSQKNGLPLPKYITDQVGTEFVSTVTCPGGIIGRGKDRSKKGAEMKAAEEAFAKLSISAPQGREQSEGFEESQGNKVTRLRQGKTNGSSSSAGKILIEDVGCEVVVYMDLDHTMKVLTELDEKYTWTESRIKFYAIVAKNSTIRDIKLPNFIELSLTQSTDKNAADLKMILTIFEKMQKKKADHFVVISRDAMFGTIGKIYEEFFPSEFEKDPNSVSPGMHYHNFCNGEDFIDWLRSL